MNGDNHTQSESNSQEDFNVRETADAIDEVVDFVGNTKTAIKVAQEHD